MNLLSKLSSVLPFGKKEQLPEYFFALNISTNQLTAALWSLRGKYLEVLETVSEVYHSEEDLTSIIDVLLDKVLGNKEVKVEKILFGVPETWLLDEDLKDEYLKLLRNVVKQLELQPMAYVSTSHALIHFLEKREGVPTTAILVGFEQKHITVTVVRAGKLDGTKVIERSSNIGMDTEKTLLAFTQVETLPSKILIYAQTEDFAKLEKIRGELMSFQWMSKLSFLHFPKIESLEEDIEIKSVCFAGGFEIDNDVVFITKPKTATLSKPIPKEVEEEEIQPELGAEMGKDQPVVDLRITEETHAQSTGFVVGDVSEEEESGLEEGEEAEKEKEVAVAGEIKIGGESNLMEVDSDSIGVEDEEATYDHGQKAVTKQSSKQELDLPKRPSRFSFPVMGRIIPKSGRSIFILLVIILIVASLVAAYIFVPKADIKIFVEPRDLEKDSQVTADPKQKTIDEERKIIPGQIVETEVSGTEKGLATGTKDIGDPAKGVVVIRNKTDEEKKLSKGAILVSPSGLKFALDTSVNIASRSAEDGTYGKANANVVAQNIGAEGNLPSGTDLKFASISENQLTAKSEGNFSGGTSKKVTVVSDSDQKKLLAQVASNLRKDAQQKLQEKLPDKKVLEEALSEEIVKKSFNKNVNDQANEFSLTLTVRFKGTSFDDKDLKQIVSDLVTTQVPEGFQLSLQDSETQADVSKLEDDGKLIFLARFKAKMIPKLDVEKIKKEIRGKTLKEAAEIIKGIDNVLGSEIKVNPTLSPIFQNLPILSRNINVEVGFK